MTPVLDPVLHALSVEPRRARAGETVRALFRTRNLGTSPSPAGAVVFTLPAGLEPLGATEVAVAPVAPGGLVCAALEARVAAPVEESATLTVGAALRLNGRALPTNACSVLVYGRPLLDGDAGGTVVEAIDGETARVRAVVCNQGDGPARKVRLTVPAPLGSVRLLDGAPAGEPALLERDRLDPGERLELSFQARIVTPGAELRADEATIECDGACGILPVRAALALAPAVAPPLVTLAVSRRRLEVIVAVRNAGWAEARDVRVRITVPAPLSVPADGAAIDGFPLAPRGRGGARAAALARLESRPGEYAFVLAAIPARETATVSLAAASATPLLRGSVVVAVNEVEVSVPYAVEPVRELRVRPAAMPRSAGRGDAVEVTARIANLGDLVETLTVALECGAAESVPAATPRTLQPGAVTMVSLAVRVPDDVAVGTTLAAAVVVCDGGGERARFPVQIAIRGGARLITPAEPSEPPAPEETVAAAVRAAFDVPSSVPAGMPFAARLTVEVEEPRAVLAIRLRAAAGAVYVAGSTRLDGRIVVDPAPAGAVAISEPPELTLRGIAAATRLTCAWTLIATAAAAHGEVEIAAGLDADGVPVPLAPARVVVDQREAFPLRPADVPYDVESCDVIAAPPALPDIAPRGETLALDARAADAEFAGAPFTDASAAVPERVSAFEPSLRLDPARLETIARLFGGRRGDGMVAHLFALHVFFPDPPDASHGALAEPLEELRGAVGGVFDRLFVKLRIPGFDVCSDDVEDPALRRALLTLLRALGEATPPFPSRERCVSAPFGAPVILRALARLLPRRCDAEPALGDALARYADALDDMLARYEDLPLELFDDALARCSFAELDEARAGVLGALGPYAGAAQLAC